MPADLYLRVTVPDDYADVHPELILSDMCIRECWEVAVVGTQPAPQPAPLPECAASTIEGEPGHESCSVCGHLFPNREPAPLPSPEVAAAMNAHSLAELRSPALMPEATARIVKRGCELRDAMNATTAAALVGAAHRADVREARRLYDAWAINNADALLAALSAAAPAKGEVKP